MAEIAPAAARYDRPAHGPELVRWDGTGRRIERVTFNGRVRRRRHGDLVERPRRRQRHAGHAFEQATLLYLLSLEGEAGHACPAVCTIGMARALRRRADPTVRDRFLPRCSSPIRVGATRLAVHDRGSGWQRRRRERDHRAAVDGGAFRVSGEKWFCSVADADQFLITAASKARATARVAWDASRSPRARRRAQRLRVAPAEGEAWYAQHGIRRDRLRRRARLSDRTARGGIQDRGRRRAEHFALVDGHRCDRDDAARGRRGAFLRAEPPGLRAANRGLSIGAPDARVDDMRVARRTAPLVDAHGARGRDRRGHRRRRDSALPSLPGERGQVRGEQRGTRVVRDGIEVLGGNGTIEDFSVLPRLTATRSCTSRGRARTTSSPSRCCTTAPGSTCSTS